MLEVLAIFFIGFFPGYVLLLLDKRLTDIERICLGLGISFLIISPISFVLKTFSLPISYAFYISIAVSTFLFLILRRGKVKLLPEIPKGLVYVILLSFFLRFIFQGFVVVPTTGDSFAHLTYAKSFLSNDWFTVDYVSLDSLNCDEPPCPVEYRPPFFNFVIGFFYNIFGSSFEVAKLTNVVISTFMLIPIYLIAQSIGGRKLSISSVLLISLIPIYIGLALESEVRVLAIYLSLTSVYFFLKDRKFWMYTGSFLGLLYITHYSEAVATIFSIIFFLVIREKKNFIERKNILAFLMLVLVASPWLIRNTYLFGSPLHSTSIKLTLTNNPNELFSEEQPNLSSFLSQPFEATISKKMIGFVRSVIPLPFKDGKINFNILNNQNLTSNSVGSLITIPILVLSILFLLKNRKRHTHFFVLTFFLTSILISFIFIGGNDIYTYAVMLPSSTLLILFGLYSLSQMKRKHRIIIFSLIFISLLTQLPTLHSKFIPKTDFSQQWIIQNTEKDDRLMVRWTNAAALNYFTGRIFYSLPFEDAAYVKKYALNHNVSYLIIDRLDLNQEKVSLESLNQELELQYIYNTTDRSELKETYWIFKI